MRGPISAIVAATADGGIGFEGKIPWSLPADLALFRRRTICQPVIMGRVTYESIPPEHRPLKGRHNIIVSSTIQRPHNDPNPSSTPVYVRSSTDEALRLADRLLEKSATNEIIVAGGAAIYEDFWPLLSYIYLTRIYSETPIKTDRQMPEILEREWIERYRSPVMPAPEAGISWSVHVFDARRGTGIL